MPFKEELTQIYEGFIKPPLESLGYIVKRADDIYSPTPILNDILNSIEQADMLIAELTGRNPNVFYELGRAHEKGKQVILICQNVEDVPFDLKHIRLIVYENTPKGYEKLKNMLIKFEKNYQVNDPHSLEKGASLLELRNKIEEIKKFGTSRISDLVSAEPFANILAMSDMVYNELYLIKDQKELGDNLVLFDFLHFTILLIENTKDKLVLLRLLLKKIKKKEFIGFRHFYDRFDEYLDDVNVRKFISEEENISLLVDLYVESPNFTESNITSKILLKIKDDLDRNVLTKIAAAFLDNNQIHNSYKAKKNTYDILYPKLDSLPKHYKDELKKRWNN